jgi:DNA-directed RNA polymerase subunit RPC12/RpoP
MPVVKSFNCPSCGAPIKDIKNPKVTCEYCGSTYCIEGLDSCLNVVKKRKYKKRYQFRAMCRYTS